MFEKIKSIIILVLTVFVFLACNKYQKLLKSTDYELKYTEAIAYYEKKEYLKSIQLLDELLVIYKGTAKAEEVNYYYAEAHYGNNDFILAGYYLKKFANMFPKSKHAEQCSFQSAQCFYYDSPNYKLDQSNTYRAIEEFQVFVNKFPESPYVDTCNYMIDNLRDKLEIKSYYNAKLYLDLEDYKAATIALKSALKDFPDTKFREEISFYAFKSAFLYAKNSIRKKRKERYIKSLDEYYVFIDEFSESQYLKKAEKYFVQVTEEIKEL